MRTILTIIFLSISVISNAQIGETMHFNIDFDLSIRTHFCFDKSEKINTADFELDFFLMTNKAYIKNIELKKNIYDHYNLNGTYEFVVTSLSFRPTLVVMVKPKYKIVSNCENIIKTYLIDFEKVDLITESIGKPGYTLSINLGSVKLSDKHFIRIKNTGKNIIKEYEFFHPQQPNLPFRYSIDNWYQIDVINIEK